jgi:peroxiredoxin Q/BCP
LAPEFALEGTDGTPESHRVHRLSEHRGHPVVLVFYPGDDTPVCTEQLTTYTQDVGRFRDLGAQVLAISPQGVESHDRFAAHHGGFGFPLLADEDKSVGDAYGIVGPLGFYRRSVFVIDPDGIIVWIHRSIGGLSFQPTDDLVAALGGSIG